MIRVMVADDHPVVRDGLRALFEQLPDMELVAEAATGAEAVRAAVTERPDVVIMDLSMPDMDGFDATREITKVAPDGNVAGANAGNYTTTTAWNSDDQQTSVTQGGGTGYTDTPRTTNYGYDGNANQNHRQGREVPRGFRTVHPIGWAVWKGLAIDSTEEKLLS